MLSALVIVGLLKSTSHAAPTCEAHLTPARHVRAVFPRGVTLRLEAHSVAERDAALAALDFVGENERPRYSDRLMIPTYSYDRLDPVELHALTKTGWEMALLVGDEWIDSANADVLDTPTPASFGPSIYTRHWRVLHGLSRGLVKRLRRAIRPAPVYELRILNAPVHHVRALWLHDATDDRFIVISRAGKADVLDTAQMRNAIDAASTRVRHGMKNYVAE